MVGTHNTTQECSRLISLCLLIEHIFAVKEDIIGTTSSFHYPFCSSSSTDNNKHRTIMIIPIFILLSRFSPHVCTQWFVDIVLCYTNQEGKVTGKWTGEKKVKSGGWLFCRIFSCDTANIGESPTNGPWIGTRYLHTSPTTSPPSTGILRANIECATDWLWEMKTRKANITLRGRGGDGYLNLATVISCGRKFLRSLRCQASTILTSEIIAVLENSVFEGGGETELGNCRS